MDGSPVRATVAAFRGGLPNVELRYAVKANRDPVLLRALADSGLGFALWSRQDLGALRVVGIDLERIHLTHPRPGLALLERARDAGVRLFTIDSLGTLARLACIQPGTGVLIRVHLTHDSAALRFPYRHGIDLHKLGDLWRATERAGLVPRGIAVHLGSQVQNSRAWESVGDLIESVQEWLPATSVINLGGGLPVRYADGGASWEAHIDAISAQVGRWHRTGGHFILEPGRALVAESGWLVTRVERVGRHGGRRLLVLNVSSSTGLGEAPLGIRYRVVGPQPCVELLPTLLAGPEGYLRDPLGSQLLPQSIRARDWIAFAGAGAYTTALLSGDKSIPVLWADISPSGAFSG